MDDYPALARFKSKGSDAFCGLYVNIRLCDYSWGDEYDLAAEVVRLYRSGGLEGLGFRTRRLPHGPGKRDSVSHLICSPPGEPEPAHGNTYVFPVVINNVSYLINSNINLYFLHQIDRWDYARRLAFKL